MKKTLTLCFALLLVFSALSGCAAVKPGGDTPDAGQAGTVSGTPDTSPSAANDESAGTGTGIPSVDTEEYEYSSDYIDVRLELPRVTGLPDSAVEDSINKIFGDIMTEAKNGVKAAEEESKQLVEEYDSAASYMTYISYSVPYNKDGILSILVSDYRYLGGAHGSDFWASYSFDLKTGKELSLGDLMAEDSGYREMINASIRAEIDIRTGEGELMEIATFLDIGDDPAYYLTSDAVVFYFQEYEYFPYAAGIQEFLIQYADLKGMLTTEYAVLATAPVVLDNTRDNTLSAGDIGQVVLYGNPTTGYTWHYAVSDETILKPAGTQYQSDAPDADGAGGTCTWDFKALKTGKATVTFKYYRDWEGEAAAAPEDCVTFTVVVK